MNNKKPSSIARKTNVGDVLSEAQQENPKTIFAKEINGYEAQGLKEPTRYGDWEVKGRCSDF